LDDDHDKKMLEDEEYKLRVMMIKKKHRGLYRSMMRNRKKRLRMRNRKKNKRELRISMMKRMMKSKWKKRMVKVRKKVVYYKPQIKMDLD
jgi:hypothetical protein